MCIYKDLYELTELKEELSFSASNGDVNQLILTNGRGSSKGVELFLRKGFVLKDL